MTDFPAVDYVENAARTAAEMKVALDAIVAGAREQLGGSAETTLTIASGNVTPGVGAAGIFSIDTQAAAPTDDLSNIVQTNVRDGALLLIRCANAARVVTVKHNAGGAGTIVLAGSVDLVLDATTKWLWLKRTGTSWQEIARFPAIGDVTATGATTALSLAAFYGSFLMPQMFGAVGNGVADDTTALNAFFAACAYGRGFIPAGTYLFTSTLNIPAGAWIEGEAVGEWMISEEIGAPALVGVTLLASGTGTRDKTLRGVSSCEPCGGVRVISALTYKLLSFMNSDATTGAAATSRAFSAAVVVAEGAHTKLTRIRIVPAFSGVSGYTGSGNGLGADWDVGLWIKNAHYGVYDEVQTVGYWRMAGTLVSSHKVGALTPSAEHNTFKDCIFQGYRGLAMRAPDRFRCTARTATTVEVPYYNQHPWDAGGGAFRSDSDDFAYTGTSVTGDKLTLTGVSPDPTALIAVNDEVRAPGTLGNFGFAGTRLYGGYVAGLDHHTNILATDSELATAFAFPSAALEISGQPIRGVAFFGTTIQTREDVLMHLHDVRDLEFFGCYREGKTAAAAIGGSSSSIAKGSRVIASPLEASSTATYPKGETDHLHFWGCSTVGVDSFPQWAREASPRFSDAGLFTPGEFIDDEFGQPDADDGYYITLPGTTTEYRIRNRESVTLSRLARTSGVTVLTLSSEDGTSGGSLRAGAGIMDLRAGTSAVVTLRSGSTTKMQVDTSEVRFHDGKLRLGLSTGPFILQGAATPEAAVTAPVGSLFIRTDGGAGTTLYVKQSGTGNTGWVGK